MHGSVWKHTEVFEFESGSGPLINACFQTLPCLCKRSVKSVIDVYLQHVFEPLIIVVNHRHIWWVREHNGQSEVFTNPLKSAKSVIFLKFQYQLGIVVGTFDNTRLYRKASRLWDKCDYSHLYFSWMSALHRITRPVLKESTRILPLRPLEKGTHSKNLKEIQTQIQHSKIHWGSSILKWPGQLVWPCSR